MEGERPREPLLKEENNETRAEIAYEQQSKIENRHVAPPVQVVT